MLQLRTFLLGAALLVSLAACGNGGSGNGGAGGGNPPPDNALFNRENDWTGAVPEGAQTITPAEFTRLVGSGEYALVRPGDNAARRRIIEQQIAADAAYLETLKDAAPAARAALAAFRATAQPGAEPTFTLSDGQNVRLLSAATQLQAQASSERGLHDAANGAEVYTRGYEALPEASRADLPTPASLAGAPLDTVQAALARLNTVLAQNPQLLQTALPLTPAQIAAGPSLSAQAINAGNGSDNNGLCNPRNLAGQVWWPLKDFISPMKNQANRGTCWAFASIGALESRERVQFGRTLDLSEQFLVNKVKQDWDAEDYGDGFWADRALALATDRGQNLPLENGWTYNPAMSRANGAGSEKADYVGTCAGYSGTCSPTAHQSSQVCSTGFLGFTSCAYSRASYTGSAASPLRTVSIASGLDNLPLQRTLLSQGYTLIASFATTPGFRNVTSTGGYLTDEASTGGGGHAVQIVGFIDDDTLNRARLESGLSLPGGLPAGGGYFIVKNSWGCGWGDAGYAYVSARYAADHFSLLALNFSPSERSEAWRAGSQNPPPVLRALGPDQLSRLPLRQPAAIADVRLPVGGVGKLDDVTVTLGSNVPGDTVRKGSTFFGATTLEGTFVTPGPRTVTLTAALAGRSSQLSFTVTAVNTLPRITLQGPAGYHVGETYTIRASITDPNETDINSLCQRSTWRLSDSAPATLSGGPGCTRQLTPSATGSLSVLMNTTDSDGGTAYGNLSVDILPALPNPYPRLNGGAVRRTERVTGGLCAVGTFLPEGTRLDLRQNPGVGCGSPAQPNVSPYTVSVGVENPSNEALTYTWFFWVGSPSNTVLTDNTAQNVTPYFVYTYSEADVPCGVSVRVNAPEAGRSKLQPIWSGTCYGKIKPIG